MLIKRACLSTFVVSTLLLLSSIPCFAQPYAFVPDFGNGTVQVIETSDGEAVFDSIAVGNEPIGVAISPNGRHVFVTNQGSGTISIIDATQLDDMESSASVWSVMVGRSPTGIVVSPDGRWVFVANQNDDNVSIIAIDESDPQYSEEIETIDLGIGNTSKPVGLAIFSVSEDLYYLYVTNRGTNEVHEIEISVTGDEITYEVTATVGVGDSPMGIAVSSYGDYVYVANVGDGTHSGSVSVVSVADIDATPVEFDFDANAPNDTIFKPYTIVASPDNKYVYVSNRIEKIINDELTPKPGVVSVLEWFSGELIDTENPVNVGKRPSGMALSPELDRMFVANRGSGTVSSIDLDSTFFPEDGTASEYADLDLGAPVALGQFIGHIAPQRPTNLAATVVSDTEIELTWEHSEEGTPATGFLVNARTESSGTYTEFAEIPDGTADSCIVRRLTEGTTYYFHVAAVNEDTQSSYADHALKSVYDSAVRSTFSEEGSATTHPAAPSGLREAGTSSQEIKLRWKDNSQAESHFVVERKKMSAESTSEDDETDAVAANYDVIESNLPANTTSYSDRDEDLEANATYSYRVKAVDDLGQESEYSNRVEAKASDECFIATAAFGSLLEPHVVTLRKFRDAYLSTNTAGRVFVRFYYATSPPIADFIRSHTIVRTIVRWSLIPIVAFSHCTLQWGFPMTLTLLFSLSTGAVLVRRHYL